MQFHLQLTPLFRGSTPLFPKAFKIFYKNKWTSAFLPPLNGIQSLFSSVFSNKLPVPGVLLVVFFMTTTLIVNAQNTTWRGVTSDWNTSSNWSVGTPTSSSNVIIPALGGTVAYNPVLSAAGICKTITSKFAGASISGTGTLTIAPAGTTSIASSLTISCPLSLSATIIFSVSSTLTISGAISGTGSILKIGSGTLNLGSATTSFNTLTVNEGPVYMGGNATFNALTLNGGNLNLGGTTTIINTLALTSGTLVIGSNTLIANGSVTRSSGFLGGSSSSNLTLGGSSAQSLYFASSDTLLNNLTLNHTGNATSTLNTSLEIYGSISFASSNDNLNLNSQHLTLNSDINGTAYIGQINGSLTNATNVTAERYIDGTFGLNGKRSWRLLTIPVTGQTIRQAWAGVAADGNAPFDEVVVTGSGTIITGHHYINGSDATAAGFDWFSGLGSSTTSSIRYYNIAHSWASSFNTPDVLNIPNQQGYMLYVRGDRSVASSTDTGFTTLMPTGTLKQGPQTIPVTEQYTVVGNPYTSPIDIDAVYNNSGNSSVIKRNFWVWDATLGTSGGYRALGWNGSGYDMTGAAGNASDYLILNSGQAFFVEQQAAGSITIEESNKSITAPQTMFRPMQPAGVVSSLSIKLFEATASTLGLQMDGVLARYNDIYNVSPYETYDAVKMNNFNENLSLVRNSRYLSIESRPYPTQSDTLFIPFWGLKVRDYALAITSNKFLGLNQTARVIDGFTHTQKLVDLSDATTIFPFSTTSDPASTSLNRFTIIMVPSPTLGVTFTKIDASLNGNKVKLTWNTGSEVGVKNYDVEKGTDGIHFSKIGNLTALNTAMGNSYQLMDAQPSMGKNFYRIRSNDDNGDYNYSSIAVVQLTGKKGIQVTPTIISNQCFTLSLTDQPSGNYSLLLTNASGQQIYQKMISNMGGKNSQVIDMGKTTIPAGVYTLSVSDATGNKQNFRLLINH